MRLGVFGGSFDPVHLGHLILAEQCREQARLDQVLFVPAARPPHKPRMLTPFDKRVEMLALALSGQRAFRIEELENQRDGPSYTVDTLGQLKQRHPDAELGLILGADSLNDLPYWYEPGQIVALATLLIVGRPGWEIPPRETLEQGLRLPRPGGLRYQVIASPLIEIASRDIRQRIQAGQSVRYQIPRGVEAYIADKGLYRADREG